MAEPPNRDAVIRGIVQEMMRATRTSFSSARTSSRPAVCLRRRSVVIGVRPLRRKFSRPVTVQKSVVSDWLTLLVE